MKKPTLEERFREDFSQRVDSTIGDLIEKAEQCHSLPFQEGREPESIFLNKAISQHMEALARLIHKGFDEQETIVQLFVMLALAFRSVRVILRKVREHISLADTRKKVLLGPVTGI